MTLNEIFTKYDIPLRDENGFLRNVIDIIEDMYIKLTPAKFREIIFEIGLEETQGYPFEEERKKGTL